MAIQTLDTGQQSPQPFHSFSLLGTPVYIFYLGKTPVYIFLLEGLSCTFFFSRKDSCVRFSLGRTTVLETIADLTKCRLNPSFLFFCLSRTPVYIMLENGVFKWF